jgi:transposase
VHQLDERIKQYDAYIRCIARAGQAAKRLMQSPGIGETTATAIVAMVGNGVKFTTGSSLPGSAWSAAGPTRAWPRSDSELR